MFRSDRPCRSSVPGKGVETMTDYIIPCILLVTAVGALHKKENAYDLMLGGAA